MLDAGEKVVCGVPNVGVMTGVKGVPWVKPPAMWRRKGMSLMGVAS